MKGKRKFGARFGFAFFRWGSLRLFLFVIFGSNGDFDKEIMKGKRRFGARFGFAFLRGGRGAMAVSLLLQLPSGALKFLFFTFLVQSVILIKRL